MMLSNKRMTFRFLDKDMRKIITTIKPELKYAEVIWFSQDK